jgi:biopolymer transport protein ExbB/TolQ
MLLEEFELGGPIMYALFGVWVLVLSLILERLVFWTGRLLGRPGPGESEAELRERADRNVARIDGLSHLATSLGLFGTVLGIATAFFSRGSDLALAAPEVLASGMATALFTTVAGLSIFLLGQASLLLFSWWLEAAIRRVQTEGGGAS